MTSSNIQIAIDKKEREELYNKALEKSLENKRRVEEKERKQLKGEVADPNSYHQRMTEDTITKNSLLKEPEFIKDASNFLKWRLGEDTSKMTPEEIYNNTAEHYRSFVVNEGTQLNDLVHSQTAKVDELASQHRLYETFGKKVKIKGEVLNTIMDYVQGIATAPSTIAIPITTGTSKLAGAAVTLGNRLLVRAALQKAYKQSLYKTAGAEAAIGALGSYGRQGTEKNIGQREEISGAELVLDTGLAAAVGTGVAAFSGTKLTSQPIRKGVADTLETVGLQDVAKTVKSKMGIGTKGGLATSRRAIVTGEQILKKATDKAIDTIKQATVRNVGKEQFELFEDFKQLNNEQVEQSVSEYLKRRYGDQKYNPLDPKIIAEGNQVRERLMVELDLTPGEGIYATLDPNIRTRIQAAAIDIIQTNKDFKPKRGERITATINRVFAEGHIDGNKFNDVLTNYNINASDLFKLFVADTSRAAKDLAELSKSKKIIGNVAKQKIKDQQEDKLNKLKELLGRDEMDVSYDPELFLNIEKNISEWNIGKTILNNTGGIEAMRRAFMTSQPRTASRNFYGGGARVFADAVDTMFEEGYKKMFKQTYGYNPAHDGFSSVIKDSTEILKFIFNPAESEVIAQMYNKTNPEEYQKLFSTMMEGSKNAFKHGAKESILTQVGAKVNFLNRAMDNIYKKAAFAGELSRLVRNDPDLANLNGKNQTLIDLIGSGQFKDIPMKHFKRAEEKAYELTYQDKFKKLTPGEGIGGGDVSLEGAANYYINQIDKLPGVNMATGMLLPFPRFVASQTKFMVNHAPILGAILDERWLKHSQGKTFKERAKKLAPELVAKQISGTMAVGTAAMYRSTQPEGSPWYEHTFEDGTTTDLRPLLGPLNLTLYFGHQMNAYSKHLANSRLTDTEGEFKPDVGGLTYDMLEMALGRAAVDFNIGYLANDVIPAMISSEELTPKAELTIARMLGDHIGTFFYPIMPFKDVYNLSSAEARVIQSAREGVTFYDTMMERAMKNLPTLPDSALDLAFNPIREQGTRRIIGNPLAPSVTGIVTNKKKTKIQKETDRLGMQFYEIVAGKRIRFPTIESKTNRIFNTKYRKRLDSFIENPLYKNIESNVDKRAELKNVISEMFSMAQQEALIDYENEINRGFHKPENVQAYHEHMFMREIGPRLQAFKVRFKKETNGLKWKKEYSKQSRQFGRIWRQQIDKGPAYIRQPNDYGDYEADDFSYFTKDT